MINKAKEINRLLRYNFYKKLSFFRWCRERKAIKNWLYLYFCYSSLLLDLLEIVFGGWKCTKGLNINVRRSEGPSFYFPVVNGRYWSLLTEEDPYEEDFVKPYLKRMNFKKDDVIIEIGAYVGRFCIPLFMEHSQTRVFAFEPEPSNFQCLRKNLGANNIDKSRFTIEPLAVYGKPGKYFLRLNTVSTRGSIADAGFLLEEKKKAKIGVRATTLEDIFRQNKIERCKLLKIGCAGSEYAIFENISDEALSKIENMFVEVHSIKGRTPALLKEFFKNKGFKIEDRFYPKYGILELFCVQTKGGQS